MTKPETILTPLNVRNEWVDRLLQENWVQGRHFLCTRDYAAVDPRVEVHRYDPLGLLMQLAEDFQVIPPGEWCTERPRRKGWRDLDADVVEYRQLTPTVARWAGIGVNPGFRLSAKWLKSHGLEMWPDGHKFALSWLWDYTTIKPAEIASLINRIE